MTDRSTASASSPESSGRPRSRAALVIARLIALSLPFLVMALAMELGLRVMGITHPVFYQTDEHRGFGLRPGFRGWWITEGRSFISVNSDGFRDREHPVEKPASVYRIAVLGDSFTEAMSVPAEQAFWSVLESELKACGALAGKTPEVLNFGVSSYGTAQEYLTLHHNVWKYDPDLVLVAFFSGNDVRNNSRALEQGESLPYYVLKDGELSLDDSFRTSAYYARQTSWKWKLLRSVLDQSHLAQYLNMIRTRVMSRAQAAQGNQGEAGVDVGVYREPRDATWKDAWEVTEALFRKIRDEVREKRSRLLVATVSNAVQTAAPADREAMVKRQQIEAFYPEDRVVRAGRRDGYAVFNLARALQKQAEEQKAVFHGFAGKRYGEGVSNGHWNSLGHRAAGELLAREICRQAGEETGTAVPR